MSPYADPRVCKACYKRSAAPFQQCGACASVYYCSKECQNDHWKSHKEDCKRVSDENSKIEQLSMMDPLIPGCQKALAWYRQAYDFPLKIAVASALGINTREEKTGSHVVVIFLDWNGKSEEDISQQFGLVEIETKLNSDYLKFVHNFQADESTKDQLRSAILPRRDHGSNDSWIDARYMIHVKCGVGKKSPDRPVSVLSQVYSLAHPRSTMNIIPSRRQLRPVLPIQPDWEELFAHDTSSAPLLHQDYQYLYFERTFRPIGINHLFQLEMGLYRQHTGGEVLDAGVLKAQLAGGLKQDAIAEIAHNKAKVPDMNPPPPRQQDPNLKFDGRAAFKITALYWDRSSRVREGVSCLRSA